MGYWLGLGRLLVGFKMFFLQQVHSGLDVGTVFVCGFHLSFYSFCFCMSVCVLVGEVVD